MNLCVFWNIRPQTPALKNSISKHLKCLLFYTLIILGGEAGGCRHICCITAGNYGNIVNHLKYYHERHNTKVDFSYGEAEFLKIQ